MNTKKCGICQKDIELNLENFASHPKRGFQSNCRICHKAYRRKHYLANQQKYIKKAKVWNQQLAKDFQEYKKTLFCSKCPENHPGCLDFHHTDPSNKEATISSLISNRKMSLDKIKEEIAKCIVLCANCHRKLHYEEQQNNNIGR